MGYNIEDVATPRAFRKDPKLVLDFYNMRRKDVAAAIPNTAHDGIAALEKEYAVTIITQNIVWFEEPVPMIQQAASVMTTADVFILIGTSLQVYPAAGLIDYVPDKTPKYIIDKKIPPVNRYENIIAIEKTATEGVGELLKMLL